MKKEECIKKAEEIFKEIYKSTPSFFSVAPGRVNLIGEHTDYNGGYVFPMAIEYYTIVAFTPRTDSTVNIYSFNYKQAYTFNLKKSLLSQKKWYDYVCGVYKILIDKGYKINKGMDAIIYSSVPLGGGLSSSAALEVSILLAIENTNALDIPKKMKPFIAQAAENNFVGMMCGIMDQFTIVFGKRGTALFLDCKTLEYRNITIPPELTVLICNTMVKHELASGEYNKRRADCEKLCKIFGVNFLRDISLEKLNQERNKIEPTLYKRALHVLEENQRVMDSIRAFEERDFEKLKTLFYSSHKSLRELYEVSCRELDIMVDVLNQQEGVIGARMTGGGFGGCCVALVEKDKVEKIRNKVKEEYKKHVNIIPEIYSSLPEDGALVVNG